MSAASNISTDAQGRELERVSAWLMGSSPVCEDDTSDNPIVLALERLEDADFQTALELAASNRARGGESVEHLISDAGERMAAALGRVLSDDARADFIAELGRNIPNLTRTVNDAIKNAYKRSGDSDGKANDAAPYSAEASLEAIKKINAAANSSLDLKETTELTAKAITEVMQVDECSVFMLDEQSNRLVLHSTFGLNPELVDKVSLGIGEGITGVAAELGKPIAVRDAWNDPRFHFIPGLYEEKYRSILVVPIVLYTVNRLLGVLSMHSREYRDFTAHEIEFVETAAGQLAMAIWNARVYEQTDAELRRRVNELTTLERTGQTITSSLDYREVLDAIVHRSAAIIDADKASIFELDEVAQRLFIVAASGLSENYVKLTLAVGEGVMGKVVETRRPIIVPDALGDTRLAVSKELIHQEGYRSMFCVPLVAKGRVLGGISVYTSDIREFRLDELRLVQAFADQAAIAMENSRLYQETRDGFERNGLLLRELHHRVKNNLQTVASLLSMQARHTESSEAADLLNLSAGRIAGMVAVHDLLSGRKLNVTTIVEIVQAIMDMVRSDLSAAGKNISLDVAGDNVEIDSERAMVIGLVVSELIWNAISHAFAERTTGSIRISVERDGDLARVEVTDDGPGLPPGFDMKRDAGLGLDIIRQLVTRDLSGSFDIRSDAGTVATVVFQT